MEKPACRAFHLFLLMLAFSAPASAQVEVIEVEPQRTTPAATAVGQGDPYSSGSAYPSEQPTYASEQPTYASEQPQYATEAAPATAGGNTGQMYYQLQLLQQEVMTLRGQVEELNNEVQRLRQQSLDRYVDIDRRLAEIAGGEQVVTTLPGGDTATATGTTPVAPVTSAASGTPQPGEYQAYRAAYELVKGQRFGEAVTAFNTFLTTYPGGRYTPNAHYWLGELYLVVEPQDLEASRLAFTYLLEQFPDNSKIPDAMYKLGKVHFLKGNRDQSRGYLAQVIGEHADSTAARLAQTFLDENF